MSRDLEGTLQITQDGAISGFSVSEAVKEILTTRIALT
jgi:hypothetical protein